MWDSQWVNRPNNAGGWFRDRGLQGTFAQLGAWFLQEYTRVVVLDADTLVLERVDELFDLGRTIVSASPEIHTDQEDYTNFNEPNALRWAVERIGVFGEPTFQGLLDSYLLDRTH